jgi:hypothetical protein
MRTCAAPAVQTPRSFQLENVIETGECPCSRGRSAGDSLANIIPNHERVHPVRLKYSSREADDRLLRLRFAIIIAPGNLGPCRGQNYVPVFELLLPDRTRMICIRRKTSHRERGSGR